MAIKHMTVKDLPPEVRKRGAARTRKLLREMLSNPFLPADQRTLLADQLRQVDRWEAAAVEPPKPVKAAPKALPAAKAAAGLLPASSSSRTPQNHSIDLSEAVTVTENPE